MGRASEAGYSLEPDVQNTQSEYGGGSSNNDMQRPSYVNTETQLQLHNPPSFSSNTNSQPSTAPKATWKRFAIPTKTDSLSSGFPFHPHLYSLNLTHDQWHLFTSALVSAAKMTATEDYLAWTTGITAGTLSAPFLVFFAPVVGYYSGKAVHKKTLVRTVKEKMREEGGLREVLRKWNAVFEGLGFQAWLEVPRVKGELGGGGGVSTVEMEAAAVVHGREMDEKKRKKVEKKVGKRFRIILVPMGEVNQGVEHNGVVFGGSGSVVGTESESGSLLGSSSLTHERGLPVSEMSASPPASSNQNHAGGNLQHDPHRETMPPAYWDATAVEAYNDVGGTPQAQAGLGQYQGQQVIHNEDGVSPIVREQQLQQQQTPTEIGGVPLEGEITYRREGGFTNT